MIDINLIRENPELVKENIKKKFQNKKLVLVDEIIRLDKDWRALKTKDDELRASRNKISEEINQAKKAKKPVEALLKKAKEIPEILAKNEAKEKEFEEEIKKIMHQIPNIIHKSVPIGKDSSEK